MGKKILLVDDNASVRRVMEYHLSQQGYTMLCAGSAEEGLRVFRDEMPDLVITDMALPGMSGLDLLREIKKESPQTPVIVVTAFGTIETAVEAMRDGAFHYVTKPVNNDEVDVIIAKAFEFQSLAEENVRLREALHERHAFENIVGRSDAMQRLFELMGRVAARDVTVLIEGESGTGKELIARAIHYNSSRSAGPFVPINCGAIPKELVESELFGSRKGAFTGATRDRAGRFEQASGGTIFLDEVIELPLDAQVKLLRVLQDREVMPLGGDQGVPVDVRVIAATNRSLETAVAAGEFREDIYYRLNVVPIHVPPLRDRRGDIPLLVNHFLSKFGQPRCKVSSEVMEALARHPWPGNVRQLENVIERAMVLQKTNGELAVDDLPREIVTPSLRPVMAAAEFPEEGINLEENEKLLIQAALDKAQGNQTRAAQLLGISRYVLLYRMQKFGLR